MATQSPLIVTRWPHWPSTRRAVLTLATVTHWANNAQWVTVATVTQWGQCDPLGAPGNHAPMGFVVHCSKVANLANDTGKIIYVRKGPKKGLNSPDFPLRRSVFYADKSDTLLSPISPDAT
jgi:hypothetical protein